MSYDPYSDQSQQGYDPRDPRYQQRSGGGPDPRYAPNVRQGAIGVPAGGCLRMILSNPKILAMLGMLAFGYITYSSSTHKKENPFTGESVVLRKDMPPEKEVALGLQSAPEMIAQFGGDVTEPILMNKINQIGKRLLRAKEQIIQKRIQEGQGQDDYEYPFQFHVLNDRKTINAFALPGGQVFITLALLEKLPNEDAVAGVLGHEIGHVLAWHSAKQMAKSGLLQTIAGAVATATGNGMGSGQAVGQMVGQLLQTKYGRADEAQADRIGAQLLIVAGYKPEALKAVMQVLAESMKGGSRPPEILSSHPFPENRAKDLDKYIEFFRREPFGFWTGGYGN